MRWRWPPENWCGKRALLLGPQADVPEQLVDTLARRSAAGPSRAVERFAHDRAGAHARVERRVGVLEDDLHVPAPQPCESSRPSAPAGRCPARSHARPTVARSGARSPAPWSSCPSRSRRRWPSVLPRRTSKSTPSTACSYRRPARTASRRRTGKRTVRSRTPRSASVMPPSSRVPAGRVMLVAHGESAAAAPRGSDRAAKPQREAKRQHAAAELGERGHDARDLGQVGPLLGQVCREMRHAGDQARACRDGSGCAITSSTAPSSTLRPAYMTTTRSAISATAPMSWVIRMMRRAGLASAGRAAGRRSAPARSRRARWSARPRSAPSAGRRVPWRSSRAGACRPTSGADSRRRAAAAASGMPHGLQHARSRAPRPRGLPMPWCRRSDLGDLLADRVDRVERGHRLLEDHRDLVAADRRASGARRRVVRSSPSSRIAPPAIRPDGLRDEPHDRQRGHATCRSRSRRRRPSVSPARRRELSSSRTRRRCRCAWRSSTRRSVDLERSGSARSSLACSLRVERVVEAVADEADRQHRHEDRQPRHASPCS